jgi:hypothetical protein
VRDLGPDLLLASLDSVGHCRCCVCFKRRTAAYYRFIKW